MTSGQNLTLLELNNNIKEEINNSFPVARWIIAEISEIHQNKSGHCYLELVEKDETQNYILAKARGTIWNSTYRLIKAYFETITGRELCSGIKILFSANIEFHELYGFSLNIKDIDPAYTMGDLEQKRQEIINRLEKEGVIDMNKSIEIPIVPQRIAIISSDTAAGYGDFMDQLNNNIYNYKFHSRLFPAIMQGKQAEESIISALENIYEKENEFDLVVIIRGGGSKADLNCFDSYSLALNIAQFPLAVITGIGHDRDESIADIVANTKTKTPTATAEFLISLLLNFETRLNFLQENIIENTINKLNNSKKEIDYLDSELQQRIKLFIEKNNNHINNLNENLKRSAITFITEKKHNLNLFNKSLNLLNPERILKRGYSITMKNGKVLKSYC